MINYFSPEKPVLGESTGDSAEQRRDGRHFTNADGVKTMPRTITLKH
jgi:hypothetical protein